MFLTWVYKNAIDILISNIFFELMLHDPSFTYLWRKINLGSRWFQFLTRSSTIFFLKIPACVKKLVKDYCMDWGSFYGVRTNTGYLLCLDHSTCSPFLALLDLWRTLGTNYSRRTTWRVFASYWASSSLVVCSNTNLYGSEHYISSWTNALLGRLDRLCCYSDAGVEHNFELDYAISERETLVGSDNINHVFGCSLYSVYEMAVINWTL